MVSKIVTDSSSNVSAMAGVPFEAVPLKIITDEQEYVDNAQLDVQEMVAQLKAYKGKSSTSCPNMEEWLAAFAGADNVYAVTITGGLSGSYNAAKLAKEEYERENPGAHVFVLDSRSAGPEIQLLLEKIAQLIALDLGFEETSRRIEEYAKHTHLLFSLQSLTNLARNGRVSPAAATVAKVLGIRVVGEATEAGELGLLRKIRGEHGALEFIVLEMKRNGFDCGAVRIAHCENPEAAQRLKKMIENIFPEADVQIGPCAGLCSFYAEQGGLMIGYEDALPTAAQQ